MGIPAFWAGCWTVYFGLVLAKIDLLNGLACRTHNEIICSFHQKTETIFRSSDFPIAALAFIAIELSHNYSLTVKYLIIGEYESVER